MKTYIKMGIIGAITGLVVATVFFNLAKAAPTADEDNNKLEKLVSQNDACRLIVYQYKGGMIRLYFPNKSEAVAAVRRIKTQSEPILGHDSREVYVLSPDCDIDVVNP